MEKIQSGYTKQIAEENRNWANEAVRMYREWEEQNTVEDHELNHNLYEKLRAVLSSLEPKVPTYRYMIHFLTCYYHDRLQALDPSKSLEDWVLKAYEDAERDIPKGKKGAEDIHLVKEYAKWMFEDFKEKGYCGNQDDPGQEKIYSNIEQTEAKWNESSFRNIIQKSEKQTSRKTLLTLALALDMGGRDLDTFLTRALENTSLNIWEPNEFLLYITFDYDIMGSKWEFFLKAKQLFDSIDEREILKRQADKRSSSKNKNTTLLFRPIEDLLAELEDITIESLNNKKDFWIDVFAQYKYIAQTEKDYEHTIYKEFKNTCESIQKLIGAENFYGLVKEVFESDHEYFEEANIIRSHGILSNEEQQVVQKLFKNNVITRQDKTYVLDRKETKTLNRGKMITLFFLYFLLKENAEFDFMSRGEELARSDYLQWMNEKLKKCGFGSYNLNNGYENLLIKLVFSNDAFDNYRFLCSYYNRTRDSKKLAENL